MFWLGGRTDEKMTDLCVLVCVRMAACVFAYMYAYMDAHMCASMLANACGAFASGPPIHLSSHSPYSSLLTGHLLSPHILNYPSPSPPLWQLMKSRRRSTLRNIILEGSEEH